MLQAILVLLVVGNGAALIVGLWGLYGRSIALRAQPPDG